MIGSFRVKATVLFALTPLAASRDTWATGGEFFFFLLQLVFHSFLDICSLPLVMG